MGRFELSLLNVRLDSCPLRLGQGTVWASPCVGFGAGVLTATGWTLLGKTEATRPWFDAELFGRVTLAPFNPAFHLEVEGGVAFPLVRDEFYFEPGRTVFRVPVAGVFLGLGASVHFW
jgi:hypothetical protein